MQNAPPTSMPAQQEGGRRIKSVPLWVVALLALLFGAIVGLAGFTFTYAQGFSYLSNDPNACMNCHVMRDEFDGWNHGSHKAVATCNDCHVPHSNVVAKYAVKALNGFRHSYAFTTGNFEEPIRILPFDRVITQNACRDCHSDLTSMIAHDTTSEPTDCLRCHAGVGHGK
jgi:cytochrome c nitrite reductase small subunit